MNKCEAIRLPTALILIQRKEKYEQKKDRRRRGTSSTKGQGLKGDKGQSEGKKGPEKKDIRNCVERVEE